MTDHERRRRVRDAGARSLGVLVLVLFLSIPISVAPVSNAEAQQQPPGKVYRIGFLSQGQPPKAWVERFKRVYKNEGTSRVRTWSGHSGQPTAPWTASRNSPKSWFG